MNTAEVVEEKVEFSDIFSNNTRKQKAITTLNQRLFELRDKLKEDMNSHKGPSNADAMLMMNDDLQQHRTVYSSSGKINIFIYELWNRWFMGARWMH